MLKKKTVIIHEIVCAECYSHKTVNNVLLSIKYAEFRHFPPTENFETTGESGINF